jgi:large subunit ribosomal protein L19
MSELIQSIERRQLRQGLPSMRMGDRVRVHFQVVEGQRRRTQVFEGVVIRLQGPGSRRTFTVRKLSFGVGVERTFPLHSPKIERLEVVARGEIRRAKLYYLRGRIGRSARLRERRDFVPTEMDVPGAMPPVDEPIPTDEPVAEDVAETAEEAVERPAEEPAAEAAVEESAEEPQAEPAEEQGAEPAEEPGAEPAEPEASADEQDAAEPKKEE